MFYLLMCTRALFRKASLNIISSVRLLALSNVSPNLQHSEKSSRAPVMSSGVGVGLEVVGNHEDLSHPEGLTILVHGGKLGDGIDEGIGVL